MSALSARFQQLKHEFNRQTAEWQAVRTAMQALPAEVACVIPEALLEELERGAHAPESSAPLVHPFLRA